MSREMDTMTELEVLVASHGQSPGMREHPVLQRAAPNSNKQPSDSKGYYCEFEKP